MIKQGNHHSPLSTTILSVNKSKRKMTSNKPQPSAISSTLRHPLSLTTWCYISPDPTLVERFIKFASKKLISSDNLRFCQMDTWAILNNTARLKKREFMLTELQQIVAQHTKASDLGSLVVLIDRRGRPAVPETTLELFRRALTPGKTIHGRKKMQVDVVVSEALWEAFLIKAMGWWVESGTAPEHITEMQLQLDLGL